MIIVHHLGISQSERVVWLCEELALPYELRRYERDPITRLAPAAYRALHPMGIAPIISDGDLVLAESGAIVEYLIARYGGGRLVIGAGQPEFASYLYWFHFANGTFVPSEMMGLLRAMSNPALSNPFVEVLSQRSVRAFDMIEKRLATARYFAGNEFSAADIMMLFPLTTLRAFSKRDIAAFPNTQAYLARIGARPAYQRAMAKGDPGMTPQLL